MTESMPCDGVDKSKMGTLEITGIQGTSICSAEESH